MTLSSSSIVGVGQSDLLRSVLVLLPTVVSPHSRQREHGPTSPSLHHPRIQSRPEDQPRPGLVGLDVDVLTLNIEKVQCKV